MTLFIQRYLEHAGYVYTILYKWGALAPFEGSCGTSVTLQNIQDTLVLFEGSCGTSETLQYISEDLRGD